MEPSVDWRSSTLPTLPRALLSDDPEKAEVIAQDLLQLPREMIKRFHTSPPNPHEPFLLEKAILSRAAVAHDLRQQPPKASLTLTKLMDHRSIPAPLQPSIVQRCAPAGKAGYAKLKRTLDAHAYPSRPKSMLEWADEKDPNYWPEQQQQQQQHRAIAQTPAPYGHGRKPLPQIDGAKKSRQQHEEIVRIASLEGREEERKPAPTYITQLLEAADEASAVGATPEQQEQQQEEEVEPAMGQKQQEEPIHQKKKRASPVAAIDPEEEEEDVEFLHIDIANVARSHPNAVFTPNVSIGGTGRGEASRQQGRKKIRFNESFPSSDAASKINESGRVAGKAAGGSKRETLLRSLRSIPTSSPGGAFEFLQSVLGERQQEEQQRQFELEIEQQLRQRARYSEAEDPSVEPHCSHNSQQQQQQQQRHDVPTPAGFGDTNASAKDTTIASTPTLPRLLNETLERTTISTTLQQQLSPMYQPLSEIERQRADVAFEESEEYGWLVQSLNAFSKQTKNSSRIAADLSPSPDGKLEDANVAAGTEEELVDWSATEQQQQQQHQHDSQNSSGQQSSVQNESSGMVVVRPESQSWLDAEPLDKLNMYERQLKAEEEDRKFDQTQQRYRDKIRELRSRLNQEKEEKLSQMKRETTAGGTQLVVMSLPRPKLRNPTVRNSFQYNTPPRKRISPERKRKVWQRTTFNPVEDGRRQRRERMMRAVDREQKLCSHLAPLQQQQPLRSNLQQETAYQEWVRKNKEVKRDEEDTAKLARTILLPVFMHTHDVQ